MQLKSELELVQWSTIQFTTVSELCRLVEYRVIEDEIKRRLNCYFKLVSVMRSVARRRLVETENPSARATVNCKVCKIAIALQLSVIKRTCNQSANKSNHPK
jgi:hypothetical protein